MSTVYSQSQPAKEHVTILAIPDDSSSADQQVSMSQSTSSEVCSIIKLPDSNDNTETFSAGNRISRLISSFERPSKDSSDIVEISDTSKNYPVSGLRVSNTGGKHVKIDVDAKVDEATPSTASNANGEPRQPPLRSSLRHYNATPQTSKHHDSPKQLKFEDEGNVDKPSAQRFIRNSQRKSKITDAYLDSLDLEDSTPMGRGYSPGALRNSSRFISPVSIEPTTTVMVFPDDEQTAMGIEVTGVQDEFGKLAGVQIIKIYENGRVVRDGRLKVGDNILEIDGRPVYQMSIIRARAYLSELANKDAPSLTIERNASAQDAADWRQNDSSSMPTKPILSLLQQANTQQIGKTQLVELEKSSTGFGFTVTGRETAKGERLFYIGTVKPNGIALGHLQGGDRLLEINGESTAELTQADVVDRLKTATVGETVKFLISRVAQNKSNKDEDEKESSTFSERENEDPLLEPKPVSKTLSATISERTESSHSHSSEYEDLLLTVPLNDTGSAGLGVSLKARVSVKHDGSRHDCGIFIKNVMHGGAAHKDGRLRVNDRIIGIEDIDFTEMSNAAASEAITRQLKTIGPNATHVRLKIRRSRKEDMSFSLDAASQTSRSSKRESELMAKSLDENELIMSMNAFDREAPHRKSLSERRGMGAATDPNHIKLFQEIKHQRQTSAPSRSTEHHGERARSASVHPKGSDTPQQSRHISQAKAVRRSLSYDKESNIPSMDLNNKDTRTFEMTSPFHPFPPGASAVIEYRNGNTGPGTQKQGRERSVEKQRRKSVGSAMKSFFGIGSKSRETSPEKGHKDTMSYDSRLNKEEERRRVMEHYDRLRMNETSGGSPQVQRAKDSISRSLSDYKNSAQLPEQTSAKWYDQPSTSIASPDFASISMGSGAAPRPQIPYHFYAAHNHNPLPLVLGNSRFYCSERPAKANLKRSTLVGSSIDSEMSPHSATTTNGMQTQRQLNSNYVLDTAPISMMPPGGSLRRMPATSSWAQPARREATTNIDNIREPDPHRYEVPKGQRYQSSEERQREAISIDSAAQTWTQAPPLPGMRTHSLTSSTEPQPPPPVPPRLALRKAIQTSPPSTENITAASRHRFSQVYPAPTTTICSTVGSHTAEPVDQEATIIRPILKQPMGLRRSYHLMSTPEEADMSIQSNFATPFRPDPPPHSHHQQQQQAFRTHIRIEPNHSSTPSTPISQQPLLPITPTHKSDSSTPPTSMPLIAFPNTRHAFMIQTPSQTRNTQERLSVRARKKVNRQSMLAKT